MLFTTGAWAADHEIALYAGGGLTSPGTLTYEADVDLDDDLLDGSDTFGALFEMRYTQWIGNDGFGVEFSRDHPTGQDTAPADPLASSDDSILTLNYHKVFPDRLFDPYVGLGIGVLNTADTHLAGPAMRLSAGGRYALNDVIDVMAEYQFTYSQNLSDPETLNGASADQHSNAINLGISFGF